MVFSVLQIFMKNNDRGALNFETCDHSIFCIFLMILYKAAS